MKFSLNTFSGICPATDARLLPGDTSQIAHNCILKSGKIIPLRKNTKEKDCSASTRTVFRQNEEWVELDFDADCVPTPVNEDQYDRIYFTGHSDGYLRMRGKFDGSNYSIRRVFVPKPSGPPEAKSSAYFDVENLEENSLTFQPTGRGLIVRCTDSVKVEANHWRIFFHVDSICSDSYMMGFPMGSAYGTLIFNEHSVQITEGCGDLEIKKNDGSVYATIRFTMESFVPFEPSCPEGTATSVGGYDVWLNLYLEYNSSSQYRSYCYTLVDDIGQEGPPSDVSEIIQSYDGDSVKVKITPASTAKTNSSVSSTYSMTTYNVGFIQKPIGAVVYERPDDAMNNPYFDGELKKIRIYRTAGTETDADFFFVDEIDYASSVEYTDTKSNAELAERLIRCENPPLNMKGLVKCSNGSLAAFCGKDLYFCEPYQPNNWPSSYNYVTSNSIVGLAVSGFSVFALTESEPEIFTGSHPESQSQYKSAIKQACLSKRSICCAESMVFYASPDGLVAISSDTSARIITENHFRKSQWQQLYPANMLAASHDNKVYLFSGKLCLIVDLSGTQMEITTADADSEQESAPSGLLDDGSDWCGTTSKVLFTVEDNLNDILYILFSKSLWSFGTGEENRNAVYRTKIIVLPYALDFSVARVQLKSYGSESMFHLFSSSADISLPIRSDTGFRIPVMRREKEWFAELRNDDLIYSLEMADSMMELKK